MGFSKGQMIGAVAGVSLLVVVGATWWANRELSNIELYQQTVENLNKLPQELCANRGHWSLKFFPEANSVDFSRTGMQGVLRADGNSGEPVVSHVQLQDVGQGSGMPPISIRPLDAKGQHLALQDMAKMSGTCVDPQKKQQRPGEKAIVQSGSDEFNALFLNPGRQNT